jgi:cytochrome c-type biogenesis protein CcmF
MRGAFDVTKEGRNVGTMHPEKRAYNAGGNAMTEAAIRSGLFGDVYVSLGDPLDGGAWSVRVYSKPFVTWIWGGCLLMAFGGLVALSDRRYRVTARREATVPAGAGRATAS